MALKCKPVISFGVEMMKQVHGDVRRDQAALDLGEKEGLPLFGRWVIFYTGFLPNSLILESNLDTVRLYWD